MHVAAALDPLGGLPGTGEFAATAAGYASLPCWLGKSGVVALAGVEGSGSYGAGLARYRAGHGVRVAGVDRAGRLISRGIVLLLRPTGRVAPRWCCWPAGAPAVSCAQR